LVFLVVIGVEILLVLIQQVRHIIVLVTRVVVLDAVPESFALVVGSGRLTFPVVIVSMFIEPPTFRVEKEFNIAAVLVDAEARPIAEFFELYKSCRVMLLEIH
jgi:hypothetical protein